MLCDRAGIDDEQDDAEAGKHTSLSVKPLDGLDRGYKSLIENTENPNSASSAHVMRLCHAPAVAIRRREGVGSVTRVPSDRATKNVGKTRWM